MLEFLRATSGKYRSIAKAEMRAVIEKSHVGFAKQSGNGAQRSAKAAVEKHRILTAEKSCYAPFEFAMEVGHSREHGRTACTQPMSPEGFVCGGEHFRMIGKAEIVIGAEINYGARFAAVVDHRACICRGEELGLI